MCITVISITYTPKAFRFYCRCVFRATKMDNMGSHRSQMLADFLFYYAIFVSITGIQIQYEIGTS